MPSIPLFLSLNVAEMRPVLVQGPYLVRSAAITSNGTLALTGDVDNSTQPITILAPSVASVTWNGEPITITSKDGNLLTAVLVGPTDFNLPSLGPWKWHDSLPETQANYTTSSTTWIGKFGVNS